MIEWTFGLLKIHKNNAFEDKKEVIRENRNANDEDEEEKEIRSALSLSKQTKMTSLREGTMMLVIIH